MSSSATHTSVRRAVIVLTAASCIGGIAACSTSTTPEVVAVPSTSVVVVAGTTSEPVSPLEPPVMVQVPVDVDPPADATKPDEVADAFVTTLTNRTSSEDDESWRRRWSKWTTPALSASWSNRGPDAYRLEVERRHGLAVGMIVGTAVRDCVDSRCTVDVVADQTLVFDGRVLNETNLVTWKLELRRDAAGWLVDSVSFGAGS